MSTPPASKWQLEREATRSFLELQDQAERCRDLHERADMQLPEPLKRFLGLGVIEGRAKMGGGVVIQPPPFKRPPVAGDDWVSVSVKDATPTAAIPAVLRDEPYPLRSKDISEKVLQLLPKVSAGSVANLFSRLEAAGVLRRDGVGWTLKNRDAAPVIHEGRLWGPDSIFQKYEIAAYRRDVIVYLLGQLSTGLQIVQILEHLQRAPWLKAPITKDIIKEDMQTLLAEGRARHRGNSRKWEVAPPRDEAETTEPARVFNFMK